MTQAVWANTVRDPAAGDVVFAFDAIDLAALSHLHIPGLSVVNDHYSAYDHDYPLSVYCIPAYLSRSCALFGPKDCVKDVNTKTAACFQINQKRTSRYIALKCAEIFKIDFDLTWSGLGRECDMSGVLSEYNSSGSSCLDSSDIGQVLSPVSMEAKWIPFNNNTANTDATYLNYGGIDWTWRSFLKNLFADSACAMITETVTLQKAALFTEKTMYSVMGKNFPIWVGGYGQANSWQSLGFDCFNDIINHDYQFAPSLLERCWLAFDLNKHILCNRDLAHDLRSKNIKRFDRNIDLLFSSQIKDYCTREIQSWPTHVKTAVGSYFEDKL